MAYRANKYIGFDDRVFSLLGIPFITLFAALVYANVPAAEFFKDFEKYYFDGLFFTTSYWVFNWFLLVVLRKRMPDLDQTAKRLSIHLLIAFLCYPVISVSIQQLILVLYAFLGVECEMDHKSLLGLFTTYILTFLILAIYEAMYLFSKYREALLDRERLRTEHVNTQLVNLRNQVNPHFLFNSLNTLMSLIPRDASTAHGYLRKLSSFYRYSVSRDDDLLVGLDQEVDQLRNYGDLIKERFGEGLHLRIDVEEDEQARILPMSLQLLVENAVKHNIVSASQPLEVHVYRKDHRVIVENTIQHRISETASTGMGLKNIHKRFSFVSKEQVIIDQRNGRFVVSLPLIGTQ